MKDQNKKIVCRDINGNLEEKDISELTWRPSIYGIIILDEKILLVPQWDGYDFPGGGVNIGETLDEALAREVWEETGLRVKRDKLVSCTEDFFLKLQSRRPSHSILLYYTCKDISGTVSTDNFDEEEKTYSKKAEWIPIADVPKLKIKFYNPVDSLAIIQKAQKL